MPPESTGLLLRSGIADYGYFMENGRIVFDGPADKLRGNDDVREF